ncbi:MAG: rhodanese-like domain-containing protein [Deltaproteobacteria bacterium]|nr:rhodanese-like domain-containing protein [Deltaproteobacteria bacterium]
MSKRTITLIVVTVALAVWWPGAALAAEEQFPSKSDPSCLKCHPAYEKTPNLLAGRFVDVAAKSKSLQLQIGKENEVIFFDDATVLKNAPEYKKIDKNEAVRITYVKRDGKSYAKEVEVKKGLQVAKEKLMEAEELAKLVAQGPEKGKYVLLDSRPTDNYDQGYIPTAKSFPHFAFDNLMEKVLPKDKDILQIYYCAGYT